MKCDERQIMDVCVGMCVVYIVLSFFFLLLFLVCRLCSRYISM
jgi:hypothetical protein